MRSCDEIPELISTALDGELTADAQSALDEHLAHCPACSALFAELRGLHKATAELDEVPAPVGFTQRVMSAVAAESTGNASDKVIPFTAAKRKHLPRKRWAASAAAIALVILGAISAPSLLGNFGSKSAKKEAADCASPASMEVGEYTATADAVQSEAETDCVINQSATYGQAETPAKSKNALNEQTSAQPAEAPEIQPTEEDPRSLRAQEILNGMTLREKICQLFIVYPETVMDTSPVLFADENTQQGLERWPVGGFLLDKKNMIDRQQVTDLMTGLQSASNIPLILTCDEEGGRVNRLMSTVGTTNIGPMLNYKDEGSQTAFENARTIASDLLSCGLNLNLAPVADVWSNPENTVIGDRAYSDDFTQAAQLITAAVDGFHAGGTACTLKHFPGHGDTSADSHYGSVYVYKTLDELRQGELIPFQAGIDAGADAVMIGHLILPDIDSEPAPFSYEIVTKLLRQEMGFDGVVMTDSLQMQAVTDYYSSAEIAVKSVQAGVDILLCPLDLEEAVTAMETAVSTGEITEARIDESVQRILIMKLKQDVLPG